MNNEQNHIDDLISRYLVGEATPEEQEQLNAWIASSVENDLYYQKLKRAFELSETYYSRKASEAAIDVDQEWNHFVNQIENKESTPNPVNSTRKKYFMDAYCGNFTFIDCIRIYH
ncbi:MAG: hypothetical protein IPJ20_01420 [Flammeovirgaceae bacterium]|nr:hypothetical protein [Flammeovirgaceae bacterium]